MNNGQVKRSVIACFMNWSLWSHVLETDNKDKKIIPVGNGFVSPAMMNSLLEKLDPIKREMLVKYYAEGITQSEIATAIQNNTGEHYTQAAVWWQIKTGINQIAGQFQ